MHNLPRTSIIIWLLVCTTLACNLAGGDDASPTPNFSRQPVGIPSPTPTTQVESSTNEEASVNTSGESESNANSSSSTSSESNCTVRTDWLTYRVVEGDTLGSIASRTGTTTSALTQANCLNDPNSIRVGQQLVVPNLPQPSSGSSGNSGNSGSNNSERLPTQFYALVESVDVSAETIRVLTGQENTFSTLRVVQGGRLVPMRFESGPPADINSFEVWQEVYVEGYIVPGNLTEVVPESIRINDVNPRSGVGPFYADNLTVESLNIDNRWVRVTGGGDIQTIMIKAAVPENTWAEVFLADGTEVSLNSLQQGSQITVNGYRWVGDHFAVEIILLE